MKMKCSGLDDRCGVVIPSYGKVCHEAAVGSSADISTASAFSTSPAVYLNYTIFSLELVKNF